MLDFTRLQKVAQKTFAALPSPIYGWWLITRDHIDLGELVTACQFLRALTHPATVTMSHTDYDALQHVLGRDVPPEGAEQTLKRHLLLNMASPLRLIERKPPNRWDQIKLTEAGEQIAQGDSPHLIIEQQLRQIRFAEQPWYPPKRVRERSGFSVSPHKVLFAILQDTEGWLERREYRLFVARQRNEKGLKDIVEQVLSFRNLPSQQQQELLDYERRQFNNAKQYSNWCDMDLHTFSLMGLGSSFFRIGHELRLVKPITTTVMARPRLVTIGLPSSPNQIALRQPTSGPSITPALPIEANTGYDAEILVAKLLRAEGFEVDDYTRARGYGFDLRVKHLQTGNVFFVEVKSSREEVSSLTLTEIEFQAAQQYGERYLLFVVEDLGQANPSIWVVQNPAQQIPNLAHLHHTIEHRAARLSWKKVAKQYKQ